MANASWLAFLFLGISVFLGFVVAVERIEIASQPPLPSWGNWFYASGATLIAATVAIAAAGIAYWAIHNQIAAEARHRRRTERLNVILPDLYPTLFYLAFREARAAKGELPENASSDEVMKVQELILKLQLMGMSREAKAVQDFRTTLKNLTSANYCEMLETQLPDKLLKTFEAIREALDS